MSVIASLRSVAKAYRNASFIGHDFHEPSIEEANKHTRSHGVDNRVKFVAATAKDIRDTDFDLITSYDCLHDMGGPRGCARHMSRILKQDGTWMIVEPIAGDHPADNMNPVGRLYYNASP
ncbi:class I SAM-dependent methyltransferase [Agrobacterium tumefaciens]|uniref:class I SAM-dependent methyltransferase n=1 Tax=Agrobacterium tumefaciens TaxID=358 RepID=UPI001E58B8F2|nr:class I SAM-dependent methyltransferase [Agrobacterium tumefaciens]